MENLFGKGLAAVPSNWQTARSVQRETDLGSYVEVISGPYSELRGVVTHVEREYAWVRLDGDAYDLRFRRDLLSASE